MARKNLTDEAKMPKKQSMGRGTSKKEPKVDMFKVHELKVCQQIRNSELRKIGLKCNLNPRKDSEECKGCSFYEECKKAKVEREYLCNNKHASIESKRRINSEKKSAMQEEIRCSHEILEDDNLVDEDDMEDAYEENP